MNKLSYNKMNLEIDNFYLTNEGEISLFQRKENIFTKEYIDDISFYIKNKDGYKIHYEFYNKTYYFRIHNFELEEDDELDYVEFRYIDNYLSFFINNKQFYLFYFEKDGFILKDNKIDSINMNFIEYVDGLVDNDLIKIRDNHFERKFIPIDSHIKSLFLQTSMKRGEENIFYNHIIINRKENLIPKIYKSTSREIIMQKYPFTIQNLRIIDDSHYIIKGKTYTFEGNLKMYIFDKMFGIICNLLELGISHNDYNNGNFLISEDLKDIVIIDFGQSYFFKDEKDLSSAVFLGDETKTIKDIIEFYYLDTKDFVNALTK